MLQAASALAELLCEENAALDRLDFSGAAAVLPRKLRAVQALAAPPPVSEGESISRELRTRLTTLAGENRRLLERAILVQGRVIGCIARAVPRAMAGNARAYGRDGGLAQPRRPEAVALSARA